MTCWDDLFVRARATRLDSTRPFSFVPIFISISVLTRISWTTHTHILLFCYFQKIILFHTIKLSWNSFCSERLLHFYNFLKCNSLVNTRSNPWYTSFHCTFPNKFFMFISVMHIVLLRYVQCNSVTSFVIPPFICFLPQSRIMILLINKLLTVVLVNCSLLYYVLQ